ncbi:MAG: 9-O-acetylesterase [Candidatus Hydrogenedentes bacterium]|nr:9-O-acetylesterase [Candidatus Hydrogenedentota bacterium]
MRRFVLSVIAVAISGCHTLGQRPDSTLALPALFSDGMVLQQGKPVAIWGKAAPGTRVRVSMEGRRSKAMANEAGRWQLYLESLDAGGPYALEVRAGRTRKVIRDVLVGEVWLCSGQSNMAMSMQPGPRAVLNVEQELAAANYPTIRLFDVPRTTKFAPQDDCPGAAWQVCTPETVKAFSAVGYFFGRDTQRELNVPIGLINASRGASPAEAWTSKSALRALADWGPVIDLMPKLIAASAASGQEFEQKSGQWFADLDSLDLGYADGKAIWADPEFDARDWSTLTTPGVWEDQGFPNLDGFAWYRKEIELPESWAKHPLRLHLTGLNDSDRTWFNGEVIGQGEGAGNRHEYAVPAHLVRAGRNVIAVRVYDMGNVGGFVGAATDLHLDLEGAPASDSVSLAGDWRFKPGMDLATAPAKPVPPVYVETNHRLPSVLFNGMIAPLVPYGLRGVLWYQGESNASRARQYRTLFPALINDWRAAFRQGDLPFLFVQLASYGAQTSDANAQSPFAELRDAQAHASHAPNTGMAVTIDIGDAENIHPRNKQDVGKRLALLALKQVYAQNVAANGPSIRDASVTGSVVHVRFDHTDGGLSTSDGAPPRGFAVAGIDNIFHWADARIENNLVVLTCAHVAEPRYVRYAWADNPDCNLRNAAGLPCAPFQIEVK